MLFYLRLRAGWFLVAALLWRTEYDLTIETLRSTIWHLKERSVKYVKLEREDGALREEYERKVGNFRVRNGLMTCGFAWLRHRSQMYCRGTV
ncbi:hypothetical protein BJX76DRAFT_319799 [Aspergillus varians]